MFELARKEPDGSTTTIRVFADNQQGEIDPYIQDLELLKAFQEFKRLVEVMKLDQKVAAERAINLINVQQSVTPRIG